MLEFRLAANQRKLELRHVDGPHFAPGGFGAGPIRVREGMTEVASRRIGVALNDGNALCRGGETSAG